MFVLKTSVAIHAAGGRGSALCVELPHLLQGLDTILSIPKKIEVFKLLVAHVPCSLHNNAQLLNSP